MTPAPTLPADTLTHDAARGVLRRVEELHAAHDLALMGDAFTEDVVYEDDGGTETVNGHADMETLLRRVWRAFPDMRITFTDGPFLAADGRGFAARGRIAGTMDGPLDPPGVAPTGARIAAEFGGFYLAAEGRVRYGRIIMDTTALAVQLGALPPPGSLGERAAFRLQRLRAPWLRRRAAR